MAERILGVGAAAKYTGERDIWQSPDRPAPTVTAVTSSWGGNGWILIEQVPEQEQTDAG